MQENNNIEKVNYDSDNYSELNEYRILNKQRFLDYRYYFKMIDPEEADEWFDQGMIDRYEKNKQNVRFNIAQAKNVSFISTTRVPTRCEKCKRVWAIEIQEGRGTKFGPNFLDQSVYKNIPCVKGDCHECKEVDSE